MASHRGMADHSSGGGVSRLARRLAVRACALLVCGAAQAAQSDEEVLALVYGDKSFVSVATGSRQSLTRAPAVATVITAEDILASGAQDLDEVLEWVPGLHVLPSLTYANKPGYLIRGIYSGHNAQVLVLINGIPITSIYLGERGDVWGGMPLEHVARIEVIRGPGSALYGADALAGVINIITKPASGASGTQAGVRAGSFRTVDTWVLHGGRWGDAQVLAYVRAGRTRGPRNIIEADAQTGLDALFGTRASHAPGPVDLRRRAFDAHLEVAQGPWRWRASYKNRDMHLGIGVASALDRDTDNDGQRFTTDLTHESDFRGWGVTLQASHFHYDAQSRVTLFPPGAFGGAFPQGMVGTPAKWERHWRFTAAAERSDLAGHRLRVGAGHENARIYKTRESKNFDLVFVPGVGHVPMPLGSMVDVSHTAPFLAPNGRRLVFLYAQDEWSIAKDWTLTAGLRRDVYSDFGGATNPRLALVWEAAYNVTAKLLYGRAFRAPTIGELHFINNPVILGNPSLQPEKLSSLEAAIAWQPTGQMRLAANVYRHRMRDIIRYVPNADPTTGSTAQNSGTQTGRGVELEATWQWSPDVRLAASHAWQRTIDDLTGRSAGVAPRHHTQLRMDWRLASGWHLGGQANRVAGRQREAGDSRPPVADYTTADVTLRSRVGASPWELALSVRNLFDADAREPSPVPGLVPNDFPQPGRSVFAELRCNF